MSTFTLKYIKPLLLILFSTFLSEQVFSQLVYESSDSTSIPTVSLQEVEISSVREPATISNLPVSAAVLDCDKNELQIKTLKNASRVVANLFMPDYGSRLTSPVYIRGVGSRINSPSVGLYVDDVPFFEKACFDFDLFDAEKIEVLRGPQGTLYGRNTMGGLINVKSKSPFVHQGTHLSLGGSNPMQLNTAISHYQLVSSDLAFSVSGGLNRHEGFFRNEFLDQMADNHVSAGGRFRLIWQLRPDLSAEFTSYYENLNQGGYPYAVFDSNSSTAMPVSYNRASSYKRQISSNGLVFNFSKPGVLFRSVTSFQYFDDKQSIDQDFSVADLAFAVQKQNQYMISQEVTARSDNKNNYQWITGVFAFNQLLDNDLAISFGQDAVNMGFVPGPLVRNQISENNTFGAAAFHQSSIRNLLVKGLTLTAGIRLDYEKAALDFNDFMQADFQTPPPSGFNSDLDFYEVLPRLGINYRVSDAASFYASVVKGYKTGGFNVVFETEEDRSFNPEKSWNYELGLKSRFFDDRLSFRSSVFYIDWKDQQIYKMLPSGQGSMLKNAGASVSKGFEVDLQAAVTSSLSLDLSYGFTHAAFVDNKLNEQVDYSGNFIPYVPRYTLFAGGNYTLNFSNGLLDSILFHVNYQALGEHFWNEKNDFSQSAYGLLNLMVSFQAAKLGLDVFANNVTATEYHSFYFSALGQNYIQSGKPSVFGLNIHYSF